jgi:1-phosphofructokinase family hexose kinase
VNTDSGYIIAVGLNPAWQKTLKFDLLRPGQVNRATSMKIIASGKGINFVRAAARWNQPARLFQFAGGANGKLIREELEQTATDNITVCVESETRMCTTCLCESTGDMTELIEPSGFISEDSAAELMALIKEALPNASGLSLCGTYPPGITENFYAEIAETAKHHHIPVMLDAWKGINKTLEIGIDVLKINLEELLALTQKQSVREAISSCLDKYPVKAVAITAGPETAYLADRSAFYSFELPVLEKIENPLGAGDTTAAVFFSEYLKGTALPEAFARGLAAASASCLSLECAVYDLEIANKLYEQIKIT